MAISGRHNIVELIGVGRDEDDEGREAAPLKPIPLPNFDLKEHGQEQYWEWCIRLREIGLLDELMAAQVEGYAIAVDTIHASLRSQKQPARYYLEQRNSFLGRMEKIFGNGKPHQQARKENAYARFGFAERSRRRRHGTN